MTPRVREILSWYSGDSLGVGRHLATLLNHGQLAGSGRVLIYSPIASTPWGAEQDQFHFHPDANDPEFHFALAANLKVSALAAPIGLLRAGIRSYLGEVPILVVVQKDFDEFGTIGDEALHIDQIISSILQLGGIGLVLQISFSKASSGGSESLLNYWAERLTSVGLLFAVWIRIGQERDSEMEPSMDSLISLARQMFLAGAHLICLPSLMGLGQATDCYAQNGSRGGAVNEVKLVRKSVLSCFDGRRLLVFEDSGYAETDQIVANIQKMAAGGGFGSIVGSNFVERSGSEARQLAKAMAVALTGQV